MPLRLCPIPGPLYTVLMGYKESPVAEARTRYAAMPSRLLHEFLAAHAGCVAAVSGGPLGAALCVPSTARPCGAPLSALDGMAEAVAASGARWSPGVLHRAGAPVGHMQPDAGAFSVLPEARRQLEGARVLLLDDTYVSGARAQSAAAVLRLAGAAAVVVVVVGRVLRPDRAPSHAAFLRTHRRAGPEQPGACSPCCRCTQAGTRTE